MLFRSAFLFRCLSSASEIPRYHLIRLKLLILRFIRILYSFTGELLDAPMKEECFSYLLAKSPSFLTTAQAFIAKDCEVFPKSALNTEVMKDANPINWWLSLKGCKLIPEDLIKELVVMYRCPSSTASVERIFSTYGFVQTDRRNKLSQETLTKLSFCFRQLRRKNIQKCPRKKPNIISSIETDDESNSD